MGVQFYKTHKRHINTLIMYKKEQLNLLLIFYKNVQVINADVQSLKNE